MVINRVLLLLILFFSYSFELQADSVYKYLNDYYSSDYINNIKFDGADAHYPFENKVLKILSKDEYCSNFSDIQIMDYANCKKLFVISKDQYSLHNKIFSFLKTKSGEALSKRLLVTPSNIKSDILKKQSAIRYLYQNNKEYEFINKFLQFFSKYEGNLINLWLNPVSKESRYKSILLKNIKDIQLDNSPKIMALNYWKNRIAKITSPLLLLIGCDCFDEVIKSTKKNLNFSSTFDGIKNGFSKYYKDSCANYGALLSPASICKRYNDCCEYAGNKYTGSLLFAYKMYNNFSIPLLLYAINDYEKRANDYLVQKLQLEVDSIVKIIKLMDKFALFCEKRADFGNNLYGLSKLKLALKNCNAFLENYKDLIEGSLWTKFGKNAYLVAAYNNLEKIKSKLVYIFEFVGEIDTYFSLAALMKSHKDNNLQPFTFAKIEENNSFPKIEMENLWNPLIKNNAALSQLKMAGNGNHVLLEGPHACGKSTLTRAIAYNFALMHAFGIAACTQASFTVFDKFLSYSNVTENPELNLSGFDAQLHELVNLKETITRLTNSGKHVFCFLDEPLTGTMEEAGAQELREFCSFIGKSENILCLLATHFNNVTDMGTFKPHYVICDERETKGEFVRQYTIATGKHPWWYTDSAKRVRYIDWMECVRNFV